LDACEEVENKLSLKKKERGDVKHKLLYNL
jgi:hypothetical protein